MHPTLESEMREWTLAVDVEAARLIRLGVPPWDAAIQARQRIEQQRRAAQREHLARHRVEAARALTEGQP